MGNLNYKKINLRDLNVRRLAMRQEIFEVLDKIQKVNAFIAQCATCASFDDGTSESSVLCESIASSQEISSSQLASSQEIVNKSMVNGGGDKVQLFHLRFELEKASVWIEKSETNNLALNIITRFDNAFKSESRVNLYYKNVLWKKLKLDEFLSIYILISISPKFEKQNTLSSGASGCNILSQNLSVQNGTSQLSNLSNVGHEDTTVENSITSNVDRDWLIIAPDLSCHSEQKDLKLNSKPDAPSKPCISEENLPSAQNVLDDSDDNSDDECIICMERKWNETLPCAHNFCSVCLKLWLDQYSECPICREKTEYDKRWLVTNGPSLNEIITQVMEKVQEIEVVQ